MYCNDAFRFFVAGRAGKNMVLLNASARPIKDRTMALFIRIQSTLEIPAFTMYNSIYNLICRDYSLKEN
jgi:hypothetical protein